MTWDLGTKQAQDRGCPTATSVPLSSPNLPLLLRSGSTHTFQYPPKANIIRKINQLEGPPKFNTFPIPLATDFGPLAGLGCQTICFRGGGCASGPRSPIGGRREWGGGCSWILKGLCRRAEGDLTLAPTPDAGVRLRFLLCSCFPHKLDARLENNVASSII